MKRIDLYQEYNIQNKREQANGVLDVFTEETTKNKSIIVCPGGGYCCLAPHEGVPIAERFASLGYRTFILYYSCAPVTFPFALTEALCAIDYVKKTYGGEVGILGFSAGGHLVGTTLTLFNKEFALKRIAERAGIIEDDFKDRRPDFGIMCYPVVSSKPDLIHQGSFDNLCGNDNEDIRPFLSLEEQADEMTPPTFFWHTVADNGVPYRNSVVMSEAIEKFGTKTFVQLFPEGKHGLGLAPDFADVSTWPETCDRFLDTLS